MRYVRFHHVRSHCLHDTENLCAPRVESMAQKQKSHMKRIVISYVSVITEYKITEIYFIFNFLT